MSFAEGIREFQKELERKARLLDREVGRLLFKSIVSGSAVTGAPGQPVDDRDLKESWESVREGEFVTVIFSSSIYAPFIESGHYKQKSATGGPHSFKLTVASFDKLVAQAVLRVKGRSG